MPAPRLTFHHAKRLHGAPAFASVFDAKCRASAGPLSVLLKPNGLPHCRLGLSVGKRCGGAVQRQHFKRMLREAFRLTQAQHPLALGGGYDAVVVLHPHRELALAEYRRLLLEGMAHGHKVWERRGSKISPP